MYIKSNDLFKETHPEKIYDNIEKPIIIADHLLTPDNMGSMIRLADNIGASEMCFLGIAPTHSLSKVKKAAASSKDNIKWYYTEDDDLRKIVGDKKIVAIETSDDASHDSSAQFSPHSSTAFSFSSINIFPFEFCICSINLPLTIIIGSTD